jgi:hypothetical protein
VAQLAGLRRRHEARNDCLGTNPTLPKAAVVLGGCSGRIRAGSGEIRGFTR